MVEMSKAENEALVSRVYNQALQDRAEGRDLARPEQLLYEIEMLVQEVGSGDSFAQYFQWASLAEISRAAERLELLGLAEPARITRRALSTAFPGGLPSCEAEMDECTHWTTEQEARLQELGREFITYSGALTNALAAFYRRSSRLN